MERTARRGVGRLMRRALPLVLSLAAALSRPAAVAAQGTDPLAAAMTAYRDLDYDRAATTLRAALAPEAPALADADRARAFMYLGAVEVFRSRRDAAVEAFRSLLLTDARYRPDELIFPPEVSTLFHETRTGFRATSVRVPAETRIQSAGDRFPVRVYASSLHEVRVAILDAFGGPVRVLHEGAVGDSLELLWNGRDGLGRLREAGRYRLRVTSRSPAGRDEREVELALTIRREEQDTLPLPAAPGADRLRPETRAASGGARFLVNGLAAALVAAALPAVAGADVDGNALRFGVAAAVGGAGVLGYLRSGRPQPIPENIEFNRRQRDEWTAVLERARAENEQRRANARLVILGGAVTTREIP